MNKKNFQESGIELNDGLKFSIIHNTSKRNMEKHFLSWFSTTFDYSLSSLIKYLDLKSGFRYFSKSDFKKYFYYGSIF